MKILWILLLVLLMGCAAQNEGIDQRAHLETQCAPQPIVTDDIAHFAWGCAPTQTPHVIVVTATDEITAEIVEVPTAEVPLICPPDYFSQIQVGYIPWFGGTKKDSASVSVNCSGVSIALSTAVIQGTLSADGTRIDNCELTANGKSYSCQMRVQNGSNFIGAFQKKSGVSEPICVAVSNKEHNAAFCGG